MELAAETGARQTTPYAERTEDGRRLRVYRLHEAGPDAPVVALVHGLEGSWDNWRLLCDGCFQQFTLFSLDLPWSGRDGYYWTHTRPAREWLHLTLDLLPRAPNLLVAHSYGVNVVLEYLQRSGIPDLAALVLMSTFYRPDVSTDDWIVFEQTLRSFRAIFEEGITLRRGKELEPALLSTMVDKVLDHIGPVGFMECFSHFLRTPALDLTRILVPTLVLAGERDPGATTADNAALAARMPRARFARLGDCGHFCMIERPAVVERAVRDFLTQDCPELLGRPESNRGPRLQLRS